MRTLPTITFESLDRHLGDNVTARMGTKTTAERRGKHIAVLIQGLAIAELTGHHVTLLYPGDPVSANTTADIWNRILSAHGRPADMVGTYDKHLHRRSFPEIEVPGFTFATTGTVAD